MIIISAQKGRKTDLNITKAGKVIRCSLRIKLNYKRCKIPFPTRSLVSNKYKEMKKLKIKTEDARLRLITISMKGAIITTRGEKNHHLIRPECSWKLSKSSGKTLRYQVKSLPIG
jgi:hypothetical protein